MRLFALKGSHELGQAVAKAAGTELDPCEEREFGDGEHKSRPLVSVRDEDVYILHSLAGNDGRSPADRLVRLLFFVGCCRDNGAARITVVAPYLAFMRKEQQTKPRDPITSRYVVQLLEAVGADVIVTIDPHNVAAFQNAVRVRNVVLDTRQLYATRIADLVGAHPVAFVTPDSGGMKRTQLLREAYEAVTGRKAALGLMEKRRSDDVVSGELFAGDVAGADVVIVDDIIASGGTILRAAEAARQHGAARVYAFATHDLRSPGADILKGPQLDRLTVTDSIAARAVTTGDKLEVLSCAPLIGEAIGRLHGRGSIHRLLEPKRR